jgi:hypothetical protein
MATFRGIEVETTVTATTKLPRMPVFWTVQRIPEILPKDLGIHQDGAVMREITSPAQCRRSWMPRGLTSKMVLH